MDAQPRATPPAPSSAAASLSSFGMSRMKRVIHQITKGQYERLEYARVGVPTILATLVFGWAILALLPA
jgi:hypothetical protein